MNRDPVRQVVLLREHSQQMITRPLHSLTCRVEENGDPDADCECCRFDLYVAGVEDVRSSFVPPFMVALEEEHNGHG